MKLLATRMVAKSFLGLESNFFIIADFAAFCCCKSSISFEVSEKRETSAADIIAEQKSKKRIPIIPKSNLGFTAEKK